MRLQAGGLAGQVEGVVACLGLLYTTFAQGQDSIMVPDNVVLLRRDRPAPRTCVRGPQGPPAPRRAPERHPDACSRTPSRTPTRGEPNISLEEIDARRGRRPHPRDPARERGRPEARRRGAGRRRQRHRRDDRQARPRRAVCRAGRRSTPTEPEPACSAPTPNCARRRSRRTRWTAPAGPGTSEASTAPARSGSGATSSSARLPSIAFTHGPRDVAPDAWCRRRAGAWRPSRRTSRRR